MPNVSVKVDEEIVFDGSLPEIPRVGDLIGVEDVQRRVESVAWDLRADSVSVTVVLESMPYGY